VYQQLGRKDSIEAAFRRLRRIEAFYLFSSSELKTLFKNRKSKLKNAKYNAVKVLSWANMYCRLNMELDLQTLFGLRVT
jgi:hypothetical protein